MPSFDFGAAVLVFDHAKIASRTGFACSDRFFCRSSGVRSFHCSSNLNSWVQYATPWAAVGDFFPFPETSSASLNFLRTCDQHPTYSRIKPSLSQYRPLIRSRRLPQNRNSVFEKGASSNSCCTMAARPSIAFRMSV